MRNKEFNSKAKLEVVKPFKWNGRSYKTGDPFKVGSSSVKKIQAMYSKGMIKHADEEILELEEEPKKDGFLANWAKFFPFGGVNNGE
jgi:hypothetical protein